MRRDKYTLAMLTFVASESVFFIVLILSFIFYRNSPANAGGPSPFNSLDVGRTAIFTACLWASSLTMWLATRGHRRGSAALWHGCLLVTIGLGAAFLYGEATEYTQMISIDHIVPNSDVFAGAFFALTGFHGLHVFVGLTLLIVLLALSLSGRFAAGQHPSAVASISLYWHFVDLVWVVIFPTVYLWSLAGPK